MIRNRFLPLCLFPLLWAATVSAAVPPDARQLLVGIANSWDSDRALLWAFDRKDGTWEPSQDRPVEVLLGRTGLAWGRGVASSTSGKIKQEGDRRTPAGLFRVGRIYGYGAKLTGNPDYPYHQVGRWDAWVDDAKNPYYNRHYVAKPGNVPPWFESQRMRLGDAAYEYKIEIRHNSDPPVPGYGSAIFFHIRRGADRPSHGCTVMAKDDLLRVIAWLKADANPHYVILPQAEYDQLAPSWGLPAFR